MVKFSRDAKNPTKACKAGSGPTDGAGEGKRWALGWPEKVSSLVGPIHQFSPWALFQARRVVHQFTQPQGRRFGGCSKGNEDAGHMQVHILGRPCSFMLPT